MKKKALISWSSGKDSAWTLYRLQQSAEYEIAGLLTTMNAAFDRVAMHGTRRALLEAQADAAGLPLRAVPLPWPCSNEQYEAAMREACAQAVADGIEVIAFGDLFLEDVRRYREEKLAGTGLTPVFPLWGLPTDELVREMIAGGMRARIVASIPRSFQKSLRDATWMRACCKPCPRRSILAPSAGSFILWRMRVRCFAIAIPIESGEVVERDGFVFADVKLSAPEFREATVERS